MYCSWASSTWELGLPGSGPGGEDVEDHLAAVHHPTAEPLLELSDLRGTQLVVEHDDIALVLFGGLLDFGDLALAHIGSGMEGAVVGDVVGAPLDDAVDRDRTGGRYQAGQLGQARFGIDSGVVDADQECAIGRRFGGDRIHGPSS